MVLEQATAHVTGSIEVSERGATLVLRIGGELDHASRAAIEPAITAAISSARSVVIELDDLTFCDSSGLTMLVSASEQATTNGTQLEVRNPRPPVKRMFTITGLDFLLNNQ